MTTDGNNGRDTGGRFGPGNPGKPAGARNLVTRAAEALLEGEAESLTRTCIELAKRGDTVALRLALERIYPAPKGRRLALELPAIETADDVAKGLAAVIGSVAAGELTTDEGAGVAGLLEQRRKAIETVELEARIAALENAKGMKR